MDRMYISFTDAAIMLGKSRASMYRLITSGVLTPYYTVARTRIPWFLRTEVKRLLVPGPKERLMDQKLHSAVKKRDHNTCRLCGVKETSLVAHHILSPVFGGEDSLKNLVTLCTLCHGNIHHNLHGLAEKAEKNGTQALLNQLIDGVLPYKHQK